LDDDLFLNGVNAYMSRDTIGEITVRSSRQDTEKHRKEIIDASARLFREKGAEGVSVPELMQAVGMTHGGFYNHFPSKDELVPVAYGKAFDEIVDKLGSATAGHDDDPVAAWNALVTYYLSAAHRDNSGGGCATAALAGDAARLGHGSTAQAAFEQGVRRMLDRVTSLQDGPHARAESLAALSTMVGALLLSRATTGDLSEEFLATARAHLMKPSKS
jgi:TetR/AcrR family transcriptional repressor of nem operon